MPQRKTKVDNAHGCPASNDADRKNTYAVVAAFQAQWARLSHMVSNDVTALQASDIPDPTLAVACHVILFDELDPNSFQQGKLA
jgi:hypothetical protein